MQERAPGVAVFDLDGTLVTFDTYLRFLLLLLAKRPGRWRAVPSLALGAAEYYAGVRENSWLKARFMELILGGMEAAALEREARGYAAGLEQRVLGQARATLERHRQAGDTLVLATASPDIYVLPLAEALRMDHVVCTLTSLGRSAIFDGRLASANCHGAEKVRRLHEWVESRGVVRGAVTCYTDHHADWPLIQWADVAVAVNPTRKLETLLRDTSMHRVSWS